VKLTVSLGQMNIAINDCAANEAKVRELAAEAARRGSHVLVLPELWSTGYDLPSASRYATRTDAGPFAAMRSLAREHGLHVTGSCLAQLEGDKIGNTAILAGPDGGKLGEYNKVHLFRPMDEQVHFEVGRRLVAPETPWGRVGLAICYDLRFPEMYRAYALAGCKLVLQPAEWPNPRLAHWQTLLRARAIENQFFIAACNRVGADARVTYFGHSCIIDPWGEIVVEAGDREMLITGEIDLTLIEQVRARIPVFADRRPEAYGTI
jgi:predicted amidohydrolase